MRKARPVIYRSIPAAGWAVILGHGECKGADEQDGMCRKCPNIHPCFTLTPTAVSALYMQGVHTFFYNGRNYTYEKFMKQLPKILGEEKI